MTALEMDLEEKNQRDVPEMRQKYTDVNKWIGNNRVFCNGRVISASELGKLLRPVLYVLWLFS